MISALLIDGVPIECINQAAVTYYVPAKVIVSVLAVEGGKVGMAKRNTNGTFDYGPMQINTVWLNKIRPYGYTLEQIQNDPCANVMVGTWILSREIAYSGNFWWGVGSYHSATVPLNQAYQTKVAYAYDLLSKFLSSPPSNVGA